MKKWVLLAIGAALAVVVSVNQSTIDRQAVIHNYANIVYATYTDSYEDALRLQQAVGHLLDHPTEAALVAAKNAWLVSRDSYGQTEAFRFYEGPIDDANGPEGRLNSWPLNEAYIDYVQGKPESGIVQDTTVAITKDVVSGKNQAMDEADVATGYHAIEFLLWGQDLSLDSPGMRPVSDYTDVPLNARRRAYLKVVTDLLVDDLAYLQKSWAPNQDNYAAQFLAADHDKLLADIMSSLATLSGFELASERLATALDSGDQEDEHSCFSDNTHNDFIMNAKGISNVFFGRYVHIHGESLYDLIKEEDEALALALESQVVQTEALMQAIPYPFDREVLATSEDSEARAVAEEIIVSLQTQADLFKQAGEALGLAVQIVE